MKYKNDMKNLRLFSMIGLVLVGTSAFADEDQLLSLKVIQERSFMPTSSVAEDCKLIDQQLKERIAVFVASNAAEINVDQINGSAKYFMKKVTRGRGSSDYIHSCEMRVRLTNDTKRISAYESNMRYTGSGRVAACEAMKTEIDQSTKVIFSQIENGLFKCLVSPIVSIENK
jgi:hypothetical protein